MKKDAFLIGQTARALYETYARDLPIIDYHNHLSVADIAADRRYGNLTELWLSPDPYKHRLMRICGVEERYITGEATAYEKFEKFCEVFPLFVGNPVYDWARMELSMIFGIDALPCAANARMIYDRAGECLRTDAFSNNGILSRFHIAYQSPVATLLDDLSGFDGVRVAPSLRGDNLLNPTEAFLEQLSQATGKKITDSDSYIDAVAVMLDRFAAAGCRFADHSLDAGFFSQKTSAEASERLVRLGTEYAKRNWTLLLHVGAQRKTSERLLRVAGPAGGYAAVGNPFDIERVCALLGQMEVRGKLPDTVLFPLNMSDQAPLAVMQGSFSEDGVASKVQLGPAWWWCDHSFGIRNTLSAVASFGVLSQFIGMTTDSRSVLSFVRHDYFRRLLCTYLAEQNEHEDWGLSHEAMGQIIHRICYQNAWNKIKKGDGKNGKI